MPVYGKGRIRLKRTWNADKESKSGLRNKKNMRGLTVKIIGGLLNIARGGKLMFNNFRITPAKVQSALGKRAHMQLKRTETGDLIYTITKV